MMMLDARRALAAGGLVEMTTTGRHTGLPRRIEIAVHGIDGHLYVSGLPGRRDWYANLKSEPHVVLHLRGEMRGAGDISIDLPADARPITDPDERRRILAPIATGWGRDLREMLRASPLVELAPVSLPGAIPPAAVAPAGPTGLVEV